MCVKVSGPGALCEHVVAGTQFDNMRRMARARRGGGRPTIRGLGREARRARSVALREAVQDGVWVVPQVVDAVRCRSWPPEASATREASSRPSHWVLRGCRWVRPI